MEDDLEPGDRPGQETSPLVSRQILSDAIRYWEPRRIAYNLILTAIVVAWVAYSWPHFRPALKFDSLVVLAVLAAWANICDCAAYVVDFAMKFSLFRQR